MNCQIFETVVNDLAREQMMEANAREAALAHSGDCEVCALRLAHERRLTFGLRALAAEMKAVSASARVEEQLREAFRSHTSSVPQHRQASRRRYWVAAAAAVVLIAFGIAGMAGMSWRFDGPDQSAIGAISNTEVKPANPPTVAIQHAAPESTPKHAFSGARPKQSARRSSKPTVGRTETLVAGATNFTDVNSSQQSEVTTEFLPWSYMGSANLQDAGQLVRVELPRSAMARFGLPVNMERYGERVKADVLVSADGLARAIRFVQ